MFYLAVKNPGQGRSSLDKSFYLYILYMNGLGGDGNEHRNPQRGRSHLRADQPTAESANPVRSAAPGSALPSIRALAKDLRISVITTSGRYDELEREGYLYTMPGKGCFVASRT